MKKSFYKAKKIHALWLFLSCFMVFLMILIGGLTRLTDSGLSMTDWKPITGLLPPMNDIQWTQEFQQYQKSPEFLKVNKTMALEEFKFIYYFEYGHRMLGRMTGLVFLIPFLYFAFVKKEFSKTETLNNAGLCLFVVFQGFLGWFMVKSGLIDDPQVSPFRLSLHLCTAFLLISLTFWQGLKFYYNLPKFREKFSNNKIINLTIFTIFMQIFWGGMVAGNDAGLIYNEFPHMGEGFIPAEFKNVNFSNFFHEPCVLQFIHRIFAFISLIFVIILITKIYKSGAIIKRISLLLLATVFCQIILGIATLLHSVPIILASLHQLVATLILMQLIYIKFLSKHEISLI